MWTQHNLFANFEALRATNLELFINNNVNVDTISVSELLAVWSQHYATTTIFPWFERRFTAESSRGMATVFKAGLRKAIAFARGTLCGCYEIDIMFHGHLYAPACRAATVLPAILSPPSNRLFSSLCPSNRHRVCK